SSIPTLVAFRQGIVVFAQPGALAAPQLEQVITAVKGLDMDEVRAELAKQEAAGPDTDANSPDSIPADPGPGQGTTTPRRKQHRMRPRECPTPSRPGRSATQSPRTPYGRATRMRLLWPLSAIWPPAASSTSAAERAPTPSGWPSTAGTSPASTCRQRPSTVPARPPRLAESTPSSPSESSRPGNPRRPRAATRPEAASPSSPHSSSTPA